MSESFHCTICGSEHTLAESELEFEYPDALEDVPEREWKERCKIDEDICSIDGAAFFVRGLLPVPVKELDSEYCWDIWAEVDAEDFVGIAELLEGTGGKVDSPVAARLANEIPYYGTALDLDIKLHISGPLTTPLLEVVDATHDLGIHQREGIDVATLGEILHAFDD